MTHIEGHKKIHLIGIGGCSMNGLAQILRARGYQVQGSDSTTSPFTERLGELGIPVAIGQKAENIGDADLVVYSAAIKPDNPERAEARRRGIPELERSVALGQLTEGYKEVVGIAGCHGKTTITSMLAMISEKGGANATVHIGGFVDFLHGGTRIGSHDLFITEACEYVESFLTLRPTVALINNIDNDHLDYYKNMDNIVAAFRRFIGLLPENGVFIGCTDDSRVKRLFDDFRGNKISYGMKDADYTPANLVYDGNGCPSFDLMFRGENLGRITLHIPGSHTVIDSMAAAAVSLYLGAEMHTVCSGLAGLPQHPAQVRVLWREGWHKDIPRLCPSPCGGRRGAGRRQPHTPQEHILRVPVQQLHKGKDAVHGSRHLLQQRDGGAGAGYLPRP